MTTPECKRHGGDEKDPEECADCRVEADAEQAYWYGYFGARRIKVSHEDAKFYAKYECIDINDTSAETMEKLRGLK